MDNDKDDHALQVMSVCKTLLGTLKVGKRLELFKLINRKMRLAFFAQIVEFEDAFGSDSSISDTPFSGENEGRLLKATIKTGIWDNSHSGITSERMRVGVIR